MTSDERHCFAVKFCGCFLLTVPSQWWDKCGINETIIPTETYSIAQNPVKFWPMFFKLENFETYPLNDGVEGGVLLVLAALGYKTTCM